MITPVDTSADHAGLVLDDVAVDLRGRELLRVSLKVRPGEIATVMGPSGSGKSTLLAAIGGFLEPTFSMSGRVTLRGADVTALAPHARHIGILFQDDLLFPHLSVGDNVAFALPADIRGTAARRQRAAAALAEVGLDGMGSRDPATLSGGQRARVALVRVLVSEPNALLLDEPFSKLDTDLREQIRLLVFAEAQRLGLPTLLVTHDADDARAAAGSIVRL
ncbi:MAG: ABC transporter ATP-binding protein [Hyphomicrobiales bacterium]|nr:MAG: ABC transporter ATP-binding protein [Hyphomicrobiales bacterium]